MPYLVSSPALARHPSAHLLITRHPALAVLLRTAVARRGDALSSQPARQSCSCIRVCICSAGRVAHELRRCSASRAASQLVVLPRALLSHGAALGSRARPACTSHSPYAQPLSPGYWADLGTALGRYMHACAAGRAQNVKSSKSVPTRTGPSHQASLHTGLEASASADIVLLASTGEFPISNFVMDGIVD